MPTIAFAPNITSNRDTGVGDWSVEDILQSSRARLAR